MTDDQGSTGTSTSTESNEAPRRTAWNRVRSHPVLAGGIAAVALAGLVFVLVWFQPQALLFDRVVDEDFPVVADPSPEPDDTVGTDGDDTVVEDASAAEETEEAPATSEADPTESGESGEPGDSEADGTEAGSPAEPIALSTGGFTSLNRYTVVGDATVYELADGSRTLRLENFESTNGPDLYVYLSAAASDAGDDALDVDAVDLGVLTGNIGNQNYDIPDDVDLDHYDTVVIWCLRFTTAFGAADLEPA